MKRLFCLSFFLIVFLFRTPFANASDFSTNYDVTYTVASSGTTHVAFLVTITNNTSDSYADTYTIEDVGFSDLSGIKASDPDGPIIPVIIKTKDGQNIGLTFNRRVVGVGKSLTFHLSFDTGDIAKKEGSVWEINIPGISNQTNFSSFDVHVRVPPEFGRPIYSKPENKSAALDFHKEDLGKAGISLAFGNSQNYAFSLSYHLQNQNIFPIRTEIALPPTTNYQNVAISSITPPPSNVVIDHDGNWLAEYYLAPSQQENVTAMGVASLSLIGAPETLSEKDRQVYTQNLQYWDNQDSQIKQLAEKLQTPQNIYNYVTTHLSYDYSRVTDNKPRLGGANALENPSSAVCLEFTDLFISIARAAGIPAREIDGYANTEDDAKRPLSLVKDVLHAWPEYYDSEKSAWIMVDPTWGNTTGGVDYFSTLDFDHFAFVVKGESSTYPVPAGGYKLSGQENNRDVNVSFSQPQNFPRLVKIAIDMPEKFLSALPIRGNVILKNAGSTLLSPQQVTVSADNLFPQEQTISFPRIPPMGSVTLPYSFDKTAFLTNKKTVVKILLAGQQIEKTIQISPFFLTKWDILGGVILVICAISIFIIAEKARRLFISRRS